MHRTQKPRSRPASSSWVQISEDRESVLDVCARVWSVETGKAEKHSGFEPESLGLTTTLAPS